MSVFASGVGMGWNWGFKVKALNKLNCPMIIAILYVEVVATTGYGG
jgi:hypothetical protein